MLTHTGVAVVQDRTTSSGLSGMSITVSNMRITPSPSADQSGNPELSSGYGWQIFNAVLGWNNTGTYGSVLAYIFYWLSVSVALIYMRFRESRLEKKNRELKSSDSDLTALTDDKFSATSLTHEKKSNGSPVIQELPEIEVLEVK